MHKRRHRGAHCIAHQEASRSLARLPNPSRVGLEEFYWPLKRSKSHKLYYGFSNFVNLTVLLSSNLTKDFHGY